MTTSDFKTLLEAARRGDRPALDQLLTTLYPAVRQLVHTSLEHNLRRKKPWLNAMFSTGDIVQDVFCRIVRELPEFHGSNEGSLVTFLATLVKNRLVDSIRFHEAMRRDGRKQVPVDESQPGAGDDPADTAAWLEQMQRLTEVLGTFSEREQCLLRARLHETSTFQELADALDYPSEDAARKAFYKAQARLAMRLRPDDDTAGA